MDFIPINKWGKDHWSLLGYLFVRQIDGQMIKHENLRCNGKEHPLLYQNKRTICEWKSSYGTRLNDKTQLDEHDDWDCLDDMENEGLVDIISLINGFYKLTDKGINIGKELMAHKAKGNNFASFRHEA
jgi:hypothetical protein